MSQKISPKFRCSILRESFLSQAVLIVARSHLFPFRTQKLSSFTSKILGWRRPGKIDNAATKLKRHQCVLFRISTPSLHTM